MKRCGETTRRSLIGLLLLASMLFYVSGAALGLHLQLEHTHGAAVAVVIDQGQEGNHPPTDAPAVPFKRTCEICEMLASVNKPVAITAPAQTLLFMTEDSVEAVPVVVCIDHFEAIHISRRGPPVT